jgi:hypothetical protein
VANLREHDFLMELGSLPDGTAVRNEVNFPQRDVEEEQARWIYEIPNPFPFHGTTYIDSGWAAARAKDPGMIRIAPPPDCSLAAALKGYVAPEQMADVYARLPPPLLYDLAANSTDADELVLLARGCCRMMFANDGKPTGLGYREVNGSLRADIDDFELFETIANNPHLPDTYKEIMVLRPGVQGGSEVVGEYLRGDSHVFEYLRRNSYIPWGHFAANMAHDSVRYRTIDLTAEDIRGLRGLYFQRMVVTLAGQLDIPVKSRRKSLANEELEELRLQVLEALRERDIHPATLWGWNFGYDFSGSGYRLHASHQMIHQQFAMVPETVDTLDGGSMPSYSCGDQVAEVIDQYRAERGADFFTDYLHCIRANSRTDGAAGESSLVVHEDDNVLLFVPKAQVSQWELQLMVTADHEHGPVGNVLEAAPEVRASIDQAILTAQHVLARLGARMVTSLEYSRRLGTQNGQRLLYAFLPKLPWSMGAFSEAQQRYICGHYPEDFAVACRAALQEPAA